MVIVLMVLAVVLVGGLTGALVWFATTRPGALDAQTLSEPTSSAAHEPLPAAVTPAAVDDVRFDQAVRGYRMSQVDGVLERLRDELAVRDDEIARLRAELDVARTRPAGDPELGHGPVTRPADDSSLWSTGAIRSYQAGPAEREHPGEPGPTTSPDGAH